MSVIRLEQTVDKELVDPPVPIRMDLFWRSSTGLSESFSLFNLKQSNDTIALDSNATIDKEPETYIGEIDLRLCHSVSNFTPIIFHV